LVLMGAGVNVRYPIERNSCRAPVKPGTAVSDPEAKHSARTVRQPDGNGEGFAIILWEEPAEPLG
jgi:hypothetical protein